MQVYFLLSAGLKDLCRESIELREVSKLSSVGKVEKEVSQIWTPGFKPNWREVAGVTMVIYGDDDYNDVMVYLHILPVVI